MIINDIKEFEKEISGKLYFDYNLQKLNWFNIGGKARIYFRPESLNELISFLKLYKKRGKIFILGAGSNVLFDDSLFDGVVIKLGKKFSNISKLKNNSLIVGSSVSDKNLSEFAKNENIGGFEFLSCIPGSVGGGIKMNSGCFKKEFKDILVSVQATDLSGRIFTIPVSKINFYYRGSDLPKEYIFLSATFKGKKKNKELIQKEIDRLKNQKELSQPTRIKTGGSTFKNPVDQTKKKVWELIKESVPLDTSFGGAKISDKHCNFFVNSKNSTSKDMKNLINFVIDNVKKKTGVNLDLEIILVK